MPQFVYGNWPVLETLRAGRRQADQLLLAHKVEEKGVVGDILHTAETRGVPVTRVEKRILDDLAEGGHHQNVALRVSAYPYVAIADILALARARGEAPFILILDLLQDPQNVGALLRVGDAVGIHGVVLQERRGVAITSAVSRASSGAVEHLQVAMVNNIATAMRELKENDVWLAGLDIGPNVPPIDRADLKVALGLVIGSEGDGMRRLVRDSCDLLVSLPMRGHVGSLNAATAGSIALYAAWQARGWEGWAHAGRQRSDS
jgi:23S rRNA (guanosine2251-2'-O)-methyltransferase